MKRCKFYFLFTILIMFIFSCSSPISSNRSFNSEERNEDQLISLVETLTAGGPYAGAVDTPFDGFGLYGNNDYVEAPFTFNTIPGEYRLDIVGASNGSNTASATVNIDGATVGSVSFSGSSPSTSSLTFTLNSGSTGSKSIQLIITNDDGSWDLFIDSVSLFFVGTPPEPPPAPTVPSIAVYTTRNYRNMFLEWGKSETEVNAKVNEVVNQFFYGNSDQRLYFESGSDMAYILDVNNNDVRSEGMSYGMMMCLQLNKQEEFNKLWKFAHDKMQHSTGDRTGYFAWQVSTSGSIIDQNPAPDGEEYFAMSLFMASNRWGNGSGIYNYRDEANYILDHVVAHRSVIGLPEWSGIYNMIDPDENQVVFCIEGSSAEFTDPSYHLPAFYELFAKEAQSSYYDVSIWNTIADESRQLIKDACDTTTGLAPDYSEFNGTPKQVGTHNRFEYDAWRVAMNISMDSMWFNKDSWQRNSWVDTYLNFFANITPGGVTAHGDRFYVNGTVVGTDHSSGLVAMNAVAAMISNDQVAWDFIEEFWNTPLDTGKYRYYNGCLYMFALLNLSGNYKIYDGDGPIDNPPTAPSSLSSTTAGVNQINLSWSDNSGDESGFKIERSTNGSSFSQIATVGANAESYSNTSLNPETTYYYRVRAYNSAGNSSYTATAQATTEGKEGTIPTAPSNLIASASGTGQINISWNDNSSDETGFKIDRSTDGYTWIQVGSTLANATSSSNSGLTADTTYYFRVCAYNGTGNSSYSNTDSATTESTSVSQTPYGGTAQAIPGIIEAEKYDIGGVGIAFSDTTSDNSGDSFRSDDVDIQSCSEGGYNVGWIASGEWLEYTVNVASEGSYDIDVRVSSQNNGGTLSLEMNGSTVAPSQSFNSTGGWQTWTTMTFSNISLNEGKQVLRVNMESSGFNVNYIKFSSSETNPQTSDNPYRVIDATSFTDSSNISVLNGDVVNFQGGDTSWISFELDFGTVEPQIVEVRAMDPNWGGNIIIRIDSPTGQEICRIYPSGGGTWSVNSNSTWPRPTGKKTVYVLTNKSGMQINTIEFK